MSAQELEQMIRSLPDAELRRFAEWWDNHRAALLNSAAAPESEALKTELRRRRQRSIETIQNDLSARMTRPSIKCSGTSRMKSREQHWLVRFDIQEAYRSYERREPGLGRRFNQELRAVLRRLPKDALLYSIRFDDIRRVKPAVVSARRLLFCGRVAGSRPGSVTWRPRLGSGTPTAASNQLRQSPLASCNLRINPQRPVRSTSAAPARISPKVRAVWAALWAH